MEVPKVGMARMAGSVGAVRTIGASLALGLLGHGRTSPLCCLVALARPSMLEQGSDRRPSGRARAPEAQSHAAEAAAPLGAPLRRRAPAQP